MNKTFRKTLSANDIGANGAHQGGILIPKSEKELLLMLPGLDSKLKNPDAWIICIDDNGGRFRFRFVYYNNRLHDENGTRNEYRLTHMTSYIKKSGARVGDFFEISKSPTLDTFKIRIVQNSEPPVEEPTTLHNRIKLRGWRQVH